MKTIFYGLIMFSILGGFAASSNAQVSRPTPPPAGSVPRPTPTPAASVPRPTPTPAAANQPVPPSKIAVVDTRRFADEQGGIYRYVDAVQTIAREFKTRSDEVTNLGNRLETLANELDNLMKATPVNQTVVDAKQQQGTALQTEYNNKKAKLDQDVGNRYKQIVSPVSQAIGAALDQFAAQRGVTMTLDASKILPAILTILPSVDLTSAFINDFNSKNPRAAAPATTPKP